MRSDSTLCLAGMFAGSMLVADKYENVGHTLIGVLALYKVHEIGRNQRKQIENAQNKADKAELGQISNNKVISFLYNVEAGLDVVNARLKSINDTLDEWLSTISDISEKIPHKPKH